MRVNQIDCPKCGASLKSKSGVPVGQSLSCPKCQHRFTVKAPDDAEVIEDADVVDEPEDRPAVKRKSPPPPARRSASRDDEDSDDRDEPRRRPARRDEDSEDEDEPRPKKRRPAEGKRRPRDDDDYEEEDRPRKKKRRRDAEEKEENLYWRLRHNIALRIIVWVVLLTILAVVSYLFYEYKIKNADRDNSSLIAPFYAVNSSQFT
jgi:hypothetical protein